MESVRDIDDCFLLFNRSRKPLNLKGPQLFLFEDTSENLKSKKKLMLI